IRPRSSTATRPQAERAFLAPCSPGSRATGPNPGRDSWHVAPAGPAAGPGCGAAAGHFDWSVDETPRDPGRNRATQSLLADRFHPGPGFPDEGREARWTPVQT